MQSLGLTQQQKLQQKLTPAQIQVVRMLEVPSVELIQRINEELQDNPALEEGRDEVPADDDLQSLTDDDEGLSGETDMAYDETRSAYDDYADDDSADYMPIVSAPDNSNDEVTDIPLTAGTGFGEYLKSQVYLTHMDKADRHIAKFVVWNIDDNGYLPRTAEELCDDLAFREGLMVSQEKMEDIIRQIQEFDPPGVGAHNLQECLLIQLRQKPAGPTIELAIRLLENDFDHFSNRRWDKIAAHMGLTDEQLKDVLREITTLNPKPGSAWTGSLYERQHTTVIPDFVVSYEHGEWHIDLNQGDLPSLRVNADYQHMLEDMTGDKNRPAKKDREAVRFVRQKIDAARWFIDAIRQRNETLLRTMTAIVHKQEAFFIEGDPSYLKPMVLQDIADMTGYDVSTISRVSNSKYVQTDFGVYPLKFFFSDKMTTTEGEEISNKELKKNLKEIIEAEDKRKPFTDLQIVEKMKQRGYSIARRTVTKYREQYGIPTARLRTQL